MSEEKSDPHSLLNFDITIFGDNLISIPIFEPKGPDSLPTMEELDSTFMDAEVGYLIKDTNIYLVKTRSNDKWSVYRKEVKIREEDGKTIWVFDGLSSEELMVSQNLPENVAYFFPLLKMDLTPGVLIESWWDEEDETPAATPAE